MNVNTVFCHIISVSLPGKSIELQSSWSQWNPDLARSIASDMPQIRPSMAILGDGRHRGGRSHGLCHGGGGRHRRGHSRCHSRSGCFGRSGVIGAAAAL
eukprot:s2_g77.t1